MRRLLPLVAVARGRLLGRAIVVVVLAVAAGVLLVAGPSRSQTWPQTPDTRAVRQGSDWTLAHVGSQVHVAGRVQIGDNACPTCRARVDHYNALATQPHISGAINAWQVGQCGTTARIAIATNANRRDLYLRNISSTGPLAADSANIFIGLGVTGHVALTADNGWVLHAAAHMTSNTLILPNYQGPVSCIGTTAGSTLSILEILR